MRQLVIVRHAKAKRDSPRGDHERKLTERGRAQARVLRGWTDPGQPLGDVHGTVIVSDAARTLETFELGLEDSPACRRVVVDPSLYNGIRYVSTDDVLASIASHDDGSGDVIVVGHNPTVLEVTLDLADERARAADLLREGFPLAGCAVLAFDGPRPREGRCELTALFSPPRD